MFSLAKKYLGRIGEMRNEAETVQTLKSICSDFDYRSGFLMEYSRDLSEIVGIIDTDESRHGWWNRHVNEGLRSRTESLREVLAQGGIQFLDESRFEGPDDPKRQFVEPLDMIDVTVVPVKFDEDLVGFGTFCGAPELGEEEQTALKVLVYAIFSQSRLIRAGGMATMRVKLTPREKQVMNLAVEGLTSSVIAKELTLSARTVNQHVENVAQKLGTKNRVHTAAEVVRNGLLD